VKTLFITGASRGLGLAITEYFSVKGFQIFATARNLSTELQNLLSNNVVFHELDVKDTAACREAILRCTAHFGKVDVVINNASGMTGGRLIGAYKETEIDHEFALSLIAPVHISNIVLDLRAKSNASHEVDLFFVSSSSALIGNAGSEEYPLYAAAKAAIIRFADCINSGKYEPCVTAHTLIPHNIRKNSFLQEDAASYNDACKVIEFGLQEKDNLVVPRYELEPRITID